LNILAFDFGGTQARCCLARGGTIGADVRVLQRRADDGGRDWLKRLLSEGRALTADLTPDAVAVSFGGPVLAGGRVISMHVKGWEDVELTQEMSEAFGVPVFIENDANCGALGEYHGGAGAGCRFMAYFTVSTGIGGGVILDGKLFRGAHGMAAEFGHMVLDALPDAPQYAAGKRGVLEALASGPAIAREGKVALALAGKPVPETLTAKHVFEHARAGESWAKAVLDVAIGHLARGVAAVICAYDLERVVIGGGVALAGDDLFIPLRQKVKAYLPPMLEGKAAIVPAMHGDFAPLLGAIAIALESRDD
jgi:glucokinase